MLRVASSYLIKATSKVLLLIESRATFVRGYWPEPVTQQTLAEFLKDINYFEEPKKFINIGLDNRSGKKITERHDKFKLSSEGNKATETAESNRNVDDILGLLAQETEVHQLNFDDARPSNEQFINMATNSGIFRDLFSDGKYVPDREHIRLTQEQAEKLNLLVPYYWITDQPFARVDRHPKEPDAIHYFDPIIGITAKFIHKPDYAPQQQSNDCDDDLYAHTSFYGNIIPGCEALAKPAISLDGRSLLTEMSSDGITGESQINNWTPGSIELINFGQNINKYYTVALVNLDYLHEEGANLHWMITNIRPSNGDNVTNSEEVCDYLPVHGIQGFGYSRYVFLVFQHDSKLDVSVSRVEGFSLKARKFQTNSFINKHRQSSLVPVGLSWFQTSWDVSSNRIFHDYLNMKAPVYEHVQAKLEPKPEENYPGRVPFNIYLDHLRNQKDINKQVLLERLKTVNPFDYKDQYVPPKVPLTLFEDKGPSWMMNVMFKKKNKVGYWRNLRPASALLPLNNNADLDHPLRPVASSRKSLPDFPNQYPARIKYKCHKDMPTTKPANEHQAVFIQDDHNVHIDKVMKMMDEFGTKKKT